MLLRTVVVLSTLLVGCGKMPSLEEILKPGVSCKAEIDMPDGTRVVQDVTFRNGIMHGLSIPAAEAIPTVGKWWIAIRPRPKVELAVRFFDCKETPKAGN